MDCITMAYYEHRVSEGRREVARLKRHLKTAKEQLLREKESLLDKMERDVCKYESDLEWIEKRMRESGERFPIMSADGTRRGVVQKFSTAKKVVIDYPGSWESFKKMWEFSLEWFPTINIEVILHPNLDRHTAKQIKAEAACDPLKKSLRII